MTASHPFWQQIDGIAVINLDHRQDRWQEMLAQAAQLPGKPEITRIAACLGKNLPGFGVRPWFRGRKAEQRWAPRAGCMASHRRAMLHAQQAGWKTLLVLEDDCDLAPVMTCDLDALHRILFVEHPEWDVCYLGHNEIMPPAQQVASWGADSNVLRVRGCATAHAYLVRQQVRDWVIDHTPPEDESLWRWLSRNRAIDRWYARVLFRHFSIFALSPAFLLQKTGYSDIGQHLVDWDVMKKKTVAPVNSGFERKLMLAHLHFRFMDAWDLLRGWWKQLRGF